LIGLNPSEYIDIDKCKDLEKAKKFGKVISDDELFFYDCLLKEKKNKQKR